MLRCKNNGWPADTTRFEMIPVDKKNQKTEMIYRAIKYNRPIEDGFFTTEKMKTVS